MADDATDLLEEMPANVVKKILANARPDTRADINHLFCVTRRIQPALS